MARISIADPRDDHGGAIYQVAASLASTAAAAHFGLLDVYDVCIPQHAAVFS